jgi:transcriptional regulator with XRE-family HTH domain
MTIDDRPELAELAGRIGARRRELGIGLREAAAQIGVSAATLSRVERGGHLPDRDNLFRFTRWLQPEAGGPAAPAEPHAPGAPTMEAVELHLRADPDLAPDDAEALARMVRLAYARLRQR